MLKETHGLQGTVPKSHDWMVAAILWLLALLTGLSSCDPRTPTQLVIRIDSDLIPGTELRCYGIFVEREGRMLSEQIIHNAPQCLRDGGVPLPTELGVLPYDATDLRRIKVVITANPGTTEAFSQTAIVSFERNHIVLLEMFLSRDCQTQSAWQACERVGKTCDKGGRCIGLERDPLPDLPRDAGLDAADARGLSSPSLASGAFVMTHVSDWLRGPFASDRMGSLPSVENYGESDAPRKEPPEDQGPTDFCPLDGGLRHSRVTAERWRDAEWLGWRQGKRHTRCCTRWSFGNPQRDHRV